MHKKSSSNYTLLTKFQETYGEDPFLSGQLAKAYVKGLQGDDKRYVQANAGCKHFAAYAGPEDTPPGRFKFDAKVIKLQGKWDVDYTTRELWSHLLNFLNLWSLIK